MATAEQEQGKHEDEKQDEQQENPLVEGLERLPVHPTTMVIFGATGDLSKRKLLPAIYNLAHEGALPERFNLIGVSRGDLSDDEFRDQARESIAEFSRRETDDKVLKGLLERMRYVSGTFDDESMYDKLGTALDEYDEEAEIEFNRLFYLSTSPSFFPVIAEALGEHGLNAKDGSEVRIIIEKPFGTDLDSAKELNRRVLAHFDETQVFRIDHYLGKETVQNMLVLRFANMIFEPLWNRSYVDYVQITAAEDIGIGSRAGYYDTSGALRDLIQNHLLQLLMILTMEPPVAFTADEVRDEKVKILHSIPAPSKEDVPKIAVRAQYGPGSSGGEEANGYLDEDDVPDDSTTETYAAVRLMIDNWRWAGVPFYLRTGKRLARKTTEIAVTLKPVPHLAFQQQGSLGVEPNQLILSVQPNEGVSLSLVAKIPGARMSVRPVNMEFLYGTSFMSQSPEAYERLIMDTMRGDATLFARNDEVEAAWGICDPILQAWKDSDEELPKYESGTAGPEEAEKLLLDHHKWRPL
ncbi:MAG: glucose-6-phosphate 1-dehydrogenase [Thermoleophilaceae bacterium]|jgi:glucose-6-phosphate 1-dehydrogenase|nr:glucose-6-phosphate 1-dehydrogenase [Thermoleophilaceae bacterium]